MNLITVQYRMYKRTSMKDFTGENILVKRWMLFGFIKLWVEVIDREPIPAFHNIAIATLGSSDWVSPIWHRHLEKVIE